MGLLFNQINEWLRWSVRFSLILATWILLTTNSGFSMDEKSSRDSIGQSEMYYLDGLNSSIRVRQLCSIQETSETVNAMLISELFEAKKWLKQAVQMRKSIKGLMLEVDSTENFSKDSFETSECVVDHINILLDSRSDQFEISAEEQKALDNLVINCRQRMTDLELALSVLKSSTDQKLRSLGEMNFSPVDDICSHQLSTYEGLTVTRNPALSTRIATVSNEKAKNDVWITIMYNLIDIQFRKIIDGDAARNQCCHSVKTILRNVLPILHQEVKAAQHEVEMFHIVRSNWKKENTETDKLTQSLTKSFIGLLNHLDSSEGMAVDFATRMAADISKINDSRGESLDQEEIIRKTDKFFALVPTQSIFSFIYNFIVSIFRQ